MNKVCKMVRKMMDAGAFRAAVAALAVLCAAALPSCTADSEAGRGAAVGISVSGAASIAGGVKEALQSARLRVAYEDGSEELLPLSTLPEGVRLSIGSMFVDYSRCFSQADGASVVLTVSYAGMSYTLRIQNNWYTPEQEGGDGPSGPALDPAPMMPGCAVSVLFSTASESYQEEEQKNLLEELRICVEFDEEGFSRHTETFGLEDLYGWLCYWWGSGDGYFDFELYKDYDGIKKIFSFSNSSSEDFLESSEPVLLGQEGTYSYTCKLSLATPLHISWKKWEGIFSVDVLPESGTPIGVRSAALLWGIGADELPAAPQEVALTMPLVRALGDAASGRLAGCKTEERLGRDLAAVRAYYSIDAEDAAARNAAASAIAACIGGVVKVDEGEYEYLPDYYFSDHPFPEKIRCVPKYIISGDKKIIFKGNFYYTKMVLDVSNLTDTNFDNATFSMAEDNSKYKVYVDMIEFLYNNLNPNAKLNSDEILRSYEESDFNNIGKANLNLNNTSNVDFNSLNLNTPKLDFELSTITDSEDDLNKLTSVYKVYDKKGKLDNIQISYKGNSTTTFDGNKEKDKTVLFEGNKLNTNVPNISVKVFLKLSELGPSRYIKNLVITGNYEGQQQQDINSMLTNVVFTGNVSGLKNSEKNQFHGVVYFMDKPYNNKIGNDSGVKVNGLLKLDKLEGVSYDTFGVNYGVLDLRGRDDFAHNPLEGYNIDTKSEKGINHYGHNAIYFTEKYVNNIKGIESDSSIEKKFEIFTRRVQRVGQGGSGVRNVYVDNNKYDSIADNISGLSPEDHAVSQTPRTLEEFEYYGNNGKYKTPARDSYTDDKFEKLNNTIKEILEEDAKNENNQIVLNNRMRAPAAFLS